MLLTFHGDAAAKRLPSKPLVDGFVFQTSTKLAGIHPDWYQTAFNSESAVTDLMAKYFAERVYRKKGFGYQDLVFARKR